MKKYRVTVVCPEPPSKKAILSTLGLLYQMERLERIAIKQGESEELKAGA